MSLQIKLSDYYIAYFDILGYRGLFSGNEGQNCEIIENIITAFNKISNSINQNNWLSSTKQLKKANWDADDRTSAEPFYLLLQ